jgi:hypothetical protein
MCHEEDQSLDARKRPHSAKSLDPAPIQVRKSGSTGQAAIERQAAISGTGSSGDFSLLPVKLNDPLEGPQPSHVSAARSSHTHSDSSSGPVDLDLSADLFSELAP